MRTMRAIQEQTLEPLIIFRQYESMSFETIVVLPVTKALQ